MSMNPTSEDVKDMLEAASALSLTFKDNLFVGREPNSPNNCATIFDTPGRGPLLALNDVRYDYPSIQVRVRDTNYRDGWSRINEIRKELHHRDREKRNGADYMLIACTQEPALLDWDENNRARFVTTFEIQRKPT